VVRQNRPDGITNRQWFVFLKQEVPQPGKSVSQKDRGQQPLYRDHNRDEKTDATAEGPDNMQVLIDGMLVLVKVVPPEIAEI